MRAVLLVLAVALGACAPAGGGAVAPPSAAGEVPAGMLNPAVTDATVATTICMAGYSKTIRPASSYTESLRARLLAAYGLAPGTEVELDHVVSLAAGGAPRLPNIYPELIAQAKADDVVENRVHSFICSGRLTLAAGQRQLLDLKLSHGYRPDVVVR